MQYVLLYIIPFITAGDDTCNSYFGFVNPHNFVSFLRRATVTSCGLRIIYVKNISPKQSDSEQNMFLFPLKHLKTVCK